MYPDRDAIIQAQDQKIAELSKKLEDARKLIFYSNNVINIMRQELKIIRQDVEAVMKGSKN